MVVRLLINQFVGTIENPEWVGQDVCAVLGIVNSRDALGRLEDYQKGVGSNDTLGGKQELATVKEAGLYALIFTSRKENAKRFQRWVFDEVLPSIRKTGSYSVATPKKAISYYTDRVVHMRDNLKVPRGYWCVVQKSVHLLLEVERVGYPVGEYDLLDGSIGKCWSNYRKGKEWAIDSRQALYVAPVGKEIVIKAYHLDELKYFTMWLDGEYEGVRMLPLLPYLVKKYGELALAS